MDRCAFLTGRLLDPTAPPSRFQEWPRPQGIGDPRLRLPALREALAAYRVVFGQPRQDDLLEYILGRIADNEIDAETLRRCQIDLTPR